MHNIWLKSQPAGHVLGEASVAAAEEGDRQNAALELAIIAPAAWNRGTRTGQMLMLLMPPGLGMGCKMFP